MENGYDSLQIRIWLSIALSPDEQIIILKNAKGNWNAVFVSFTPHYKDTKSLLFFEKRFDNITPKSSWPVFMNGLYEHHILTLPDQEKLQGYELPNDGSSISVEIATKKIYRLYSYHSTAINKNIPEAKEIENILSLLAKELDIKLLNGI